MTSDKPLVECHRLSAFPELLKAAEAAVREIERLETGSDENWRDTNTTYQALIAAIEKAKA